MAHTFQASEAKGKVRKEYVFSFRFGDEGRPHHFRIGRVGLSVAAVAVSLLFILATQSLYEYRESVLADVRNLEAVCEKLDQRRIFLESRPALWPVRGILTSAFGVRLSPFTDTQVFHEGLDIEAPAGAPVRAAAGGKVLRSGYEALYGNILVIDHGNGFRTVYAHLSERLFAAGDSVQKGDLIGKVGDTGRTTGTHLHYEVRVNGLPVNPTRFLN